MRSGRPGLSEEEVLAELGRRGARTLVRVRFRANRRTIWSLTRQGTVLNLHDGYRHATPEILDHFAAIAEDPRGRSPSIRRAKRAVRDFPPLRMAVAEARAGSVGRGRKIPSKGGRRGLQVGPNCATPDQQRYLDGLYARMNARHFGSRLPGVLPVRLSRRMRSTRGWVTLGTERGRRTVGEIALNLDLMLEENDGLRLEVLLHEMAHVEAWLKHGDPGHGAAWKAIARRIGCRPRARANTGLHSRPDRTSPLLRVPPREVDPRGGTGEGHPQLTFGLKGANIPSGFSRQAQTWRVYEV